MKVARITAPYQVEFFEEPKPVPQADEALVRIAYTGVCGSDLHIYKGETPHAKKDVVVGHEYSGVVEAIAPNAHNPAGLRPGDKVTGWIVDACGRCDACRAGHTNLCRELRCYGTQMDGTFREYITAPLHMLYKIPEAGDLKLYALAEPYAVAVYAVRETPVLLGDSVLVIGGGPIGVCAALAARQAGASQVAVSELQPEKLSRIREMGFPVIDPGRCDPVEEAGRLTGGKGFQCVLEATSTAPGYQLMTKAGAFRAKGMNIGMSMTPVPLVTREIMVNEMQIKAIRIHRQQVFAQAVEMLGVADQALTANLYRMISHEFPFAELQGVLQFCVDDRTYCKVMVQVGEI